MKSWIKVCSLSLSFFSYTEEGLSLGKESLPPEGFKSVVSRDEPRSQGRLGSLTWKGRKRKEKKNELIIST